MTQNNIDWTEAYLSLPREEDPERKKKETELMNVISNNVFGKDFKNICEQNFFDIDKYSSVTGLSAVVVIYIKKGRHIELTENLHRLLTHFGQSPDFCEKCKKETEPSKIGNIELLSGCGSDFFGKGYEVCEICGSVGCSLFFKVFLIPVLPRGEYRSIYEYSPNPEYGGRFIARKFKKQTYKKRLLISFVIATVLVWVVHLVVEQQDIKNAFFSWWWIIGLIIYGIWTKNIRILKERTNK